MHKISRLVAGLCTVAALCSTALAQNDAIKVRFEHTVRAGHNYLPAGNYMIRAANLATEQPVLSVEAEDGARIMIPAMRIQTADSHAAPSTQVVLERAGSDLQITKVWLAGRSYGYEIIR